MRRTKIICTIGPKTNTFHQLERLAERGMNVARLNMSYGDNNWHAQVIKLIRSLNAKRQYTVAIMVDTKGSEVRTGDVQHDVVLHKGDEFTFTIRRQPEYEENCTEVSYDGFIKQVNVGDVLTLDSGLLQFKVKKVTDEDIICQSLTSGMLSSRHHIAIEGKESEAPSITKKDWEDIDFAIRQHVDFIALSYVKDPEAIVKLKEFLKKKKATIDVIAKIESAKALAKLEEIIKASDGIMVARGDLGAEVPLEKIPLLQKKMVNLARRLNRPVIVATHLLESMIRNPTPTRAELTDISQAVIQQADAIMLSGETAAGKYPLKALEIMDKVASYVEEHLDYDNAFQNRSFTIQATGDAKTEIARNSSAMANNLKAKAILVFTRRGYMATLVSHFRPQRPIYAFTNMSSVRRRLLLYWGVEAFRIKFSQDPEKTIQRALSLLRKKKKVKKDDLVIIVSDVLAGKKLVETIQVRRLEEV